MSPDGESDADFKSVQVLLDMLETTAGETEGQGHSNWGSGSESERQPEVGVTKPRCVKELAFDLEVETRQSAPQTRKHKLKNKRLRNRTVLVSTPIKTQSESAFSFSLKSQSESAFSTDDVVEEEAPLGDVEYGILKNDARRSRVS